MQAANRLALQEAERPIKVREGDDVREIPTIEAVFRAQAKAAIGGNAFAQKDMLSRFEKADAERRLQIADDCAFWRHYIDMYHALMAEAEAKGVPPPKMLPHPDDIVINDIKGVSLCGPVTAEEEAALEKALKIRDLLVMQSVFDERVRARLKTDPTTCNSSSIITFIFDAELPKRYRISNAALATQWTKYNRLTKRTLAKTLYRGWRSIGIPLPRGRTFPLMAVPQPILQTASQKPPSAARKR